MDSVKRLIEWYLGVPPAEPGQGTAWRFHGSLPWPSWLPPWGVLLLGLAVVAYVVSIYLRDAKSASLRMRMLLIALRLAAIALVLLFLSELTVTADRTGLPTVALLIDDSASMGLEDQYSEQRMADAVRPLVAALHGAAPTRLNLAKTVLTGRDGRFLKRLQRDHKLRVYRFNGTAVPVGSGEYLRAEDVGELIPLLADLKAEGDQTRPGPAVRKVLNDLRGAPPSAVVIFSDGITSTTDADRLTGVADFARNKLVPIFTVGIGSEEPARDVHLYDLLVDEVAFVDDVLTFSAKVKAYGLEGKPLTVTLHEKDAPDILAREQVQVEADGRPTKIELAYTPTKEGEFDYVVEVKPFPKETNTENNSQTRHVSVRREKIHVLLADSLPRYEFRYVKHLLEREKSVELDTVLQEADLEYSAEDQTALEHFPVRREDLLHYDVVIFGDVNPGYLGSGVFENLRDFVRESGGGMILVAGPRFNPWAYHGTPLEVVYPVSLSSARTPPVEGPIADGFRPVLTIQGRRGSSVFRFAESEEDSLRIWSSLPELYWLAEAPELKPGAVVFAEHPTRRGLNGKLPVIAMQRFGAGKVLFHATDELWRWRFRVGDLYYGRYWVQAIRSLSRSKLLGRDRAAELTTDRLVYQRGETVHLRVRFLDERLVPVETDGVTVMVERSGDVQRPVTLSRVPEAAAIFEGRLNRADAGQYHAFVSAPSFNDVPPSTNFRVETPRRELERRRLDRAELTQSAEMTDGRFYTLADVAQLPDDVPRGQPVPLESQDPIPLWNRWELLLLFSLLLLTEWLLRKRCRLI